MLGSALT